MAALSPSQSLYTTALFTDGVSLNGWVTLWPLWENCGNVDLVGGLCHQAGVLSLETRDINPERGVHTSVQFKLVQKQRGAGHGTRSHWRTFLLVKGTGKFACPIVPLLLPIRPIFRTSLLLSTLLGNR